MNECKCENCDKKIYHHSSAGAVIIFFILLFVFAKWGPSINFSSTTQTKGEPLVVSGEGKVYVTPDIAKITVGVEESNTSLVTLQKSVNTKMQKLTDAIKALGIESKNIKTVSYNLYPQYDYSQTPNKVIGYQISSSYEVTINDFDKINDVITSATGAGANVIGSVSFDVNDNTKSEKLDEARKIAVNDAKEKAKSLASAASVSLGKILNISETQNLDNIRPIYNTAEVKTSQATLSAPNIEAGQTELDITINLSYEIR